MRVLVLVAAVVLDLPPDPLQRGLEAQVQAVADEDKQLHDVIETQYAESDADDARFEKWAASVGEAIGDTFGAKAKPQRAKPKEAARNLRTDSSHPGTGRVPDDRSGASQASKPAPKPSSLLEKASVAHTPAGEPDLMGVGEGEGSGVGLLGGMPGAGGPDWIPARERTKATRDTLMADEMRFKENLDDEESNMQTKFEEENIKLHDVLKQMAQIDTSPTPYRPKAKRASSLLETGDIGDIGASPLDIALDKLRQDNAPIEADAVSPIPLSFGASALVGAPGVDNFAADDARLTQQLAAVAASENAYAERNLGITDASNEIAPIGRFNQPFSFVQIAEALHDQGLSPDDGFAKVEAKLKALQAKIKADAAKFAQEAAAPSSFAQTAPDDGFARVEAKMQALQQKIQAGLKAAKLDHAKPSSLLEADPGDRARQGFADVRKSLEALRKQIHATTLEDERDDTEDKRELNALGVKTSFAEVGKPVDKEGDAGPKDWDPALDSHDQQDLDELKKANEKDKQALEAMQHGDFGLASSFAEVSPARAAKRRLAAKRLGFGVDEVDHDKEAFNAEQAATADLAEEQAAHDQLQQLRTQQERGADAANKTQLAGLDSDIQALLKDEQADNQRDAKAAADMDDAAGPTDANNVEERALDAFAAKDAIKPPDAKPASFVQTRFHSIIPQIEDLSMGCMHQCDDAVMNCLAAGKVCARHLGCLQERNFHDPAPCLQDVDEDKLTPHEQKLYDCATKDKCMPSSSFLERLVSAAVEQPGPVGPEIWQDLNDKMAALRERMDKEQKQFPGVEKFLTDPPARSSFAERSAPPDPKDDPENQGNGAGGPGPGQWSNPNSDGTQKTTPPPDEQDEQSNENNGDHSASLSPAAELEASPTTSSKAAGAPPDTKDNPQNQGNGAGAAQPGEWMGPSSSTKGVTQSPEEQEAQEAEDEQQYDDDERARENEQNDPAEANGGGEEGESLAQVASANEDDGDEDDGEAGEGDEPAGDPDEEAEPGSDPDKDRYDANQQQIMDKAGTTTTTTTCENDPECQGNGAGGKTPGQWGAKGTGSRHAPPEPEVEEEQEERAHNNGDTSSDLSQDATGDEPEEYLQLSAHPKKHAHKKHHGAHQKKHHGSHAKHAKHGKHSKHAKPKDPAKSWGDAKLDEAEAKYQAERRKHKSIAQLAHERDLRQAAILKGLVARHDRMVQDADDRQKQREDEEAMAEYSDPHNDRLRAEAEAKAKAKAEASSLLETGDGAEQGATALERELLALQARMDANSKEVEAATADLKSQAHQTSDAQDQVQLGKDATPVQRLALKQAQALQNVLFDDANNFRSGAEAFAEQVVKESEQLYPQLRDHINPLLAGKKPPPLPASLLQTSGQVDPETKVFEKVLGKLNAIASNMRTVKQNVEIGRNKIEREEREIGIQGTSLLQTGDKYTAPPEDNVPASESSDPYIYKEKWQALQDQMKLDYATGGADASDSEPSSLLQTGAATQSNAQSGAQSGAQSAAQGSAEAQAKMELAKLQDLHNRATSLLQSTESQRTLPDGWGDDSEDDVKPAKAPEMPWQRTLDDLIPHVEAEAQEYKTAHMYGEDDAMASLRTENEKVHDTLQRLRSAQFDPSVLSQNAESDGEKKRVVAETQTLKDKLAKELRQMNAEAEGDGALPSSLLQTGPDADEQRLDAAIARGRAQADKNFLETANPGLDAALAKNELRLAYGPDDSTATDGFNVDSTLRPDLSSIYKVPDFGMQMLSDSDPLLQVKDQATLDQENELMGGIKTTAQLKELKDLFKPGHSPYQLKNQVPDVRTEIDAAMQKLDKPSAADPVGAAISAPRILTDLGEEPDLAVQGLNAMGPS